LPPNKFLICLSEASYTNPYGKKLLSKLFWYVVFRKGGWKFFYGFVEKYGMPWSIGKLPRNAPADVRDDMAQRLDDMVQSAVAIIPDDSSIQFLETAKAKGDIHSGFLEELNTEIAIAILGQNLTSEVKGGSYAAAQTHAGVAEAIEKADRAHIEEYLNELVKIIYIVNSWETPPRIKLVKSGDIDDALAQRDAKLSAQGVRFSKNYYIKSYGFEEDDIEVDIASVTTGKAASDGKSQELSTPEPSNIASVTTGKAASDGKSRELSTPEPSKTAQTPPDAEKSSSFTESQSTAPDFQETLDSSLTELLATKEVADSLTAIISPILESLQATGDYNEALDALAEAFPKMDNSALQKTLERAIFASEAAGYVG